MKYFKGQPINTAELHIAANTYRNTFFKLLQESVQMGRIEKSLAADIKAQVLKLKAVEERLFAE